MNNTRAATTFAAFFFAQNRRFRESVNNALKM